MKKTVFLVLLGLFSFPCTMFAAYPVFDATNNLLATLQKTMDSAFQTVQKANMATLIQQGKEDFAEQVKIYEECVKQYEECVKIYKQAIRMYDWIDTNVGNARNLKTFLSCGFFRCQKFTADVIAVEHDSAADRDVDQSQLQFDASATGRTDYRQ